MGNVRLLTQRTFCNHNFESLSNAHPDFSPSQSVIHLHERSLWKRSPPICPANHFLDPLPGTRCWSTAVNPSRFKPCSGGGSVSLRFDVGKQSSREPRRGSRGARIPGFPVKAICRGRGQLTTCRIAGFRTGTTSVGLVQQCSTSQPGTLIALKGATHYRVEVLAPSHSLD